MQSQVDGNTTLGFSLIVGWGGVGWGEKEIYATSKNITYNLLGAGHIKKYRYLGGCLCL